MHCNGIGRGVRFFFIFIRLVFFRQFERIVGFLLNLKQ